MNWNSKSLAVFFLFQFSVLNTLAQSVDVERIEVQDSVFSAILDDYLLQFRDSVGKDDFVLMGIEDKSIMCPYCRCDDYSGSGNSIKFPFNSNYRRFFVFGLGILPNRSDYVITNENEDYKFMYLIKYKEINVFLASTELELKIDSSIPDTYNVKYSKHKGFERCFSVYHYEVGSAVVRVDRTVIFGKEY